MNPDTCYYCPEPATTSSVVRGLPACQPCADASARCDNCNELFTGWVGHLGGLDLCPPCHLDATASEGE